MKARSFTFLGLAMCAMILRLPVRADNLTAAMLEQEVVRLKQTWTSEATNYLNSPSFADKRLEILKGILRRTPTNVVAIEYARICSNSVISAQSQALDYDKALVECFVSLAVEQKNPERLVLLLRANCPYSIGFEPLEAYLARGWEDGIPLLCDAFKGSKNPAARQAILLSLSHAFSTIRARHKDEPDFVEYAKRWYLENRRKLVINPAYSYFGQRPAFPDPQEADLFLSLKK